MDKLIVLLEEAIQPTPDGDPFKPPSFAYLSTLSFVRFQQPDDLPDLDQAISALEGGGGLQRYV